MGEDKPQVTQVPTASQVARVAVAEGKLVEFSKWARSVESRFKSCPGCAIAPPLSEASPERPPSHPGTPDQAANSGGASSSGTFATSATITWGYPTYYPPGTPPAKVRATPTLPGHCWVKALDQGWVSMSDHPNAPFDFADLTAGILGAVVPKGKRWPWVLGIIVLVLLLSGGGWYAYKPAGPIQYPSSGSVSPTTVPPAPVVVPNGYRQLCIEMWDLNRLDVNQQERFVDLEEARD